MLCIVGLDNKLYKMHGKYIKIKKNNDWYFSTSPFICNSEDDRDDSLLS